MADLSEQQASALRDLTDGPLTYSVAGWTRPGRLGGYATQTIESLAKRGLCKPLGERKKRKWLITLAGVKATEKQP